jgi:tetratricopeptide (TPR) repeat protein
MWNHVSRAIRSLFVLLVSATGAFALPSSADAAPPDPTGRAERLSAEAADAFAAGRHQDAIRLYLDAFDISKSPETLYNVGFIYERKLAEPELAIDYYQRVVTADGVDPTLAAKAQKRMATLKDARKKNDPPPPKKQDPLPDTGPGAGPYVLVGTGGAVLATGFTFAIMATVTHADFDKAETAEDKRALQSRGQTQALVADLAMGVGAAAILGGVIWLLAASNDAPASPTPGVTPTPGGTGLRFDAHLLESGGAVFTLGGHL